MGLRRSLVRHQVRDRAGTMDFEEFRKHATDPAAVYQLSGRDVFLRDSVFQLARSQVSEEARSFDWGIYDLEEDSESDVVGEARTLPWMSPRRWMYIRNAHLARKELRVYLKSPAPRSVVILELAKRPSGWPRKIPVIKSAESSNMAAWVEERLRVRGFEIDGRATRTLIELVGEDRHRLSMELDKLALHCAETRCVDRSAVLTLTRQSQEYDVFALISCLARSDTKKALRVLNRLVDQGMTAPQILSLLYWNFRRLLVAKERLDAGHQFSGLLRDLKIWSYRGRQSELDATPRRRLAGIVLRVRQADRMCKSTGVDEQLILEQLVVDACR